MEFRDTLAAPAPPPPPRAPAMPYEVKVFRYGPGEGIERLTKVYPDRAGDELLLPEEIAVWLRVSHLERLLAGDAAGDPPTLPYSVKQFTVGYGVHAHEVPHKVWPHQDWGGPPLTEEELLVWEYLEHLEAELTKKREAEIASIDVAKLPDLLATEPAPAVEPVTASAVPSPAAPVAEDVAPVAVAEPASCMPAATPADPAPATVVEPAPIVEADPLTHARTFLRGALVAGAVSAGEVLTIAAAAGVSEANLRKAKSELGVVSRKVGVSGWVWEMRGDEEPAEEVSHAEEGQPQPVA